MCHYKIMGKFDFIYQTHFFSILVRNLIFYSVIFMTKLIFLVGIDQIMSFILPIYRKFRVFAVAPCFWAMTCAGHVLDCLEGCLLTMLVAINRRRQRFYRRQSDVSMGTEMTDLSGSSDSLEYDNVV